MNPETWLEEHGDYPYRFAFVRLRNKSAAEDALQETFLGAMKAKERYALCAVCGKYHRQVVVMQDGVLDESPATLRDFLIEQGALPELSPFVEAVQREDLAEVERLLESSSALMDQINQRLPVQRRRGCASAGRSKP